MYSAAVIGAGGFIGANLLQHLKTIQIKVVPVYRGTRLESVSKQRFDWVFFCAGNSKTYVTNESPTICLKESVIDLYSYLRGLHYDKFILISSVTVYPSSLEKKSENIKISFDDLSLYGAHKLLAEHYVKHYADSWLIARATGFFGPGLKKNLLFDLKNSRTDIYLTKESQIDYMPITYFCEALTALAQSVDKEVVNLGSGCPIGVGDLLRMKPGHFVFHDDRFQDDRQLRFEKLKKIYPVQIPQLKLFRQIKEYITDR
jgi:nucleoside-diphosphate-sugar epimerase